MVSYAWFMTEFKFQLNLNASVLRNFKRISVTCILTNFNGYWMVDERVYDFCRHDIGWPEQICFIDTMSGLQTYGTVSLKSNIESKNVISVRGHQRKVKYAIFAVKFLLQFLHTRSLIYFSDLMRFLDQTMVRIYLVTKKNCWELYLQININIIQKPRDILNKNIGAPMYLYMHKCLCASSLSCGACTYISQYTHLFQYKIHFTKLSGKPHMNYMWKYQVCRFNRMIRLKIHRSVLSTITLITHFSL